MAEPAVAPELYINRELSWVAFNQRVLAQALSEHTPLLEQAKFSAIFSNNLDEFFMVRVASLKSQVEAGVQKLSDDGLAPSQQLGLVREGLAPLLEQQQAHYGRIPTRDRPHLRWPGPATHPPPRGRRARRSAHP